MFPFSLILRLEATKGLTFPSINNVNVFPNFIRTITDKNIEKKEEYIVYAGRISNEKGVEELITTFLRLNYQDLKLKIIGDGPLLEILKNKYHSQNILFLGYLENKEVLL